MFRQFGQILRAIAKARGLRKLGIDLDRGGGCELKGGYRREVWIADAAALDALIERTGYAALAAEIHRQSRPCLHVFAAGLAADAPLGATRFGGRPDLPARAAWPREDDGAPLNFYAQIDLRDLAATVIAGRLPESGLLSFFAGDLQAYPGPIRVAAFLTPEGTALARQAPPADADTRESWRESVPVSARFEPGVTFPEFDLAWMETLELAEGGDFNAFQDAIMPPFPVLGQILGYAAWSADDLREEIHFEELGRAGQQNLRYWRSWEDWEEAKTIESRMAGGATYRPWSANDDANMRWILDHSAAITQEVERWQSLLTIESNHPMDLWINDANAIYFFVPADRLEAGDFSGVRALTTQS